MTNVKKIIVKKILSDEEVQKLEGTHLPNGYFKKVIKNNCDVYTEDGNILLRFRKNVLPLKNVDNAYDSLIKHARIKTSTRGVAGGNNGMIKLVKNNNKIQSNIIGYFDTLSIRQKWVLRNAGIKPPKCRQTSFTGQQVDKWKAVIPLIQDIDKQYKSLFPSHHKLQYKKAHSTNYVIQNTAFSTVTLNLNLQTAVHKDKGDFKEGFGNLVVIENGKYKGGYTGFPQFGIAVDVRSGDFLGMDVHHYHGNEPIEKIDENAERLSLVSYLRQGIIDKCKNEKIIPESFFNNARKIATLKRLRNKSRKINWNKSRKINRNKSRKINRNKTRNKK